MALGARDALGAAVADGLVVTGHGMAEGSPFPAHLAGHPLPDAGSLAAGEAVRRFCADLPVEADVLVLLSGGASAMLEWPVDGVDLARLRQINTWLLASGLPIAAMNAVRIRLSRLKGGGLRSLLGTRAVLQLLISDVPGDDPAVIGSGLLLATDLVLPVALPDGLLSGVLPPASYSILPTETRLVARNADLLEALESLAVQAGYPVHRPDSALSGEAWQAGESCAQTLREGPPGVTLWGGETTVVLPAQPGRGGRNQHLALAAATRLAGCENVLLLAAGTDGIDGNSADAGALVDGGTLKRAGHAGFDAEQARIRADSGAFLAASGDLVHTGPTGTNVMDIVIGLKLA